MGLAYNVSMEGKENLGGGEENHTLARIKPCPHFSSQNVFLCTARDVYNLLYQKSLDTRDTSHRANRYNR
jgi:hypothetical protein